jgi:hypothetical protein
VLQLREANGQVEYRLAADVPELNMPVGVYVNDEPLRLLTTPEWQPLGRGIAVEDVRVDEEKFLVGRGVVRE